MMEEYNAQLEEGAKNMIANARVLNVSEEDIEVLDRMCRHRIWMSKIMLDVMYNNGERLGEENIISYLSKLCKKAAAKNEEVVSKSTQFIETSRRVAGIMESLGLPKCQGYVEASVERFVNGIKNNPEVISFYLFGISGMIMRTMENAAEMRDIEMPLGELMSTPFFPYAVGNGCWMTSMPSSRSGSTNRENRRQSPYARLIKGLPSLFSVPDSEFTLKGAEMNKFSKSMRRAVPGSTSNRQVWFEWQCSFMALSLLFPSPWLARGIGRVSLVVSFIRLLVVPILAFGVIFQSIQVIEHDIT